MPIRRAWGSRLPEHSDDDSQIPYASGSLVAKISFLTLGLGGGICTGAAGSRGPQRGQPAHDRQGCLVGLAHIGHRHTPLPARVGSRYRPLTVRTIAELAKDPILWAQVIPLIPLKIFTASIEGTSPSIAFGCKLVSVLLKSLPGWPVMITCAHRPAETAAVGADRRLGCQAGQHRRRHCQAAGKRWARCCRVPRSSRTKYP